MHADKRFLKPIFKNYNDRSLSIVKKVLLVDNELTGHHYIYAKTLAEYKYKNIEVIGFFANIYKDINVKQPQECTIKKIESIFSYLKWIKEIYLIAKNEDVDTIHFLFADTLCKYFGIGFVLFRKFQLVGTFHQFRYSFLRDFSHKVLFNKMDKSIVHTEFIYNKFKNNRIYNLIHIEYPKFNYMPIYSENFAKNFWNIDTSTPVILALGDTRFDKGLDILLESLKSININFHLLIAGKVQTFDEEFIKVHTKSYRNKVTMYLQYLSDEELNMALNAADIIVLPYRKCFDGASGPLGEGVWLKKTIIGPNHGSLGNLIKSNKIGLVFESEDTNSLTRALNKVLLNGFKWNKTAESYRNQLNPKFFCEKYSDVYRNR